MDARLRESQERFNEYVITRIVAHLEKRDSPENRLLLDAVRQAEPRNMDYWMGLAEKLGLDPEELEDDFADLYAAGSSSSGPS